MKFKNKTGVEINITTIIILVLAILVLVIIALFFTGGMQQLIDRIIGVNTIYNENDVTLAKQLCETRDMSAYCTQIINLPLANGTVVQRYCFQDPIKANLKDSTGKITWRQNVADDKCKENYPDAYS